MSALIPSPSMPDAMRNALVYAIAHNVATGRAPESDAVANLDEDEIDMPGCEDIDISITESVMPRSRNPLLEVELCQVDRDAVVDIGSTFLRAGFELLARADVGGDTDGHIYLVASKPNCCVALTGYLPDYCDDESDASLTILFNFAPEAQRAGDDAAWIEWVNYEMLAGISNDLRSLPEPQRAPLAARLAQMSEIVRMAA